MPKRRKNEGGTSVVRSKFWELKEGVEQPVRSEEKSEKGPRGQPVLLRIWSLFGIG